MTLIRLTKAEWNPATRVTRGFVRVNPDRIKSAERVTHELEPPVTFVRFDDDTAIKVKESPQEIRNLTKISRGER